jgi:hypothetical protein
MRSARVGFFKITVRDLKNVNEEVPRTIAWTRGLATAPALGFTGRSFRKVSIGPRPAVRNWPVHGTEKYDLVRKSLNTLLATSIEYLSHTQEVIGSSPVGPIELPRNQWISPKGSGP